MRDVNLCYLLKENKILLGYKKRGFGKDKWNGLGGKVDPGETIEGSAVRETKEEIGIDNKDRFCANSHSCCVFEIWIDLSG